MYYFEYYILCIILIILSICTFYINKEIKEYLGIVILSVVFSAYSFEYYLGKTLLSKEKLRILKIKKEKYKNKTHKKWDERNLYQVYRDLIKIDPTAVTFFRPTELNINSKKIHTLSGVSNSSTVFCNENGYYSIANSDRYGFNNPDDEWNSNEFEFVFLGDSFTYGACVNRPNDIPSVVRDISNKPTLNLAYGGNGPLIEYAVLREYLPKKTKNIIFMYYEGNDLLNLNKELNNEILIKYLNDKKFNQNLKSLQNEIDDEARKHILSKSEGFKYGFYKLRLLRIKLKMIIDSNKDKKDNVKYRFDELEKILSLTKKLSIENQSNLYFVYLSAEKYMKYNKNSKEGLKYFEKVKSIVEKLEINFIDIHKEVFEDKKDPLELFPFGMNGHYNVKGYREVAEAIYKHIILKEFELDTIKN